jgi:hypothetical protein
MTTRIGRQHDRGRIVKFMCYAWAYLFV